MRILTYTSLLLVTLLFGATAHAAPEPCHIYDVSNPAFATWGQPYGIGVGKTDLYSRVECDGDTSVRLIFGRENDDNVYTYGGFYIYNGTRWLPYTIPGTANTWTQGSNPVDVRVAQLATGINYIASYTCENVGTALAPNWKCGCPDATCSAPNWNLQAFNFPHTNTTPPAANCQQATEDFEQLINLRYVVNPTFCGYSSTGLNLAGAPEKFRYLLWTGLDCRIDPITGLPEQVSGNPDRAKLEAFLTQIRTNDPTTCTLANRIIEQCSNAARVVKDELSKGTEDQFLSSIRQTMMTLSEFTPNSCETLRNSVL